MASSDPSPKKSFVVSEKMSDPSRQPLEVYHLSHDLRGPLNSILGFSELLLEGIEGPLTEYQEADITAIYQSAQNLLRLINELVDVSKLDADRLKFDFGPVDVEAVIQSILSFDFGPNKPEQVELVSSVTEALPPVRGNQDRVEQMIMSLVRFGFKRVKSGQIVIKAESKDKMVIIQVILGGVELSTAEMSELFKLVVHVDSAGRSELGPGGLALPLAQGLAEMHNGEVRVERDEINGTTFYLQLPVFEQ
jgi:signal transduction histidine kinase